MAGQRARSRSDAGKCWRSSLKGLLITEGLQWLKRLVRGVLEGWMSLREQRRRTVELERREGRPRKER
eukprot:2195597-Rhodomonas_salina.5